MHLFLISDNFTFSIYYLQYTTILNLGFFLLKNNIDLQSYFFEILKMC